MTTAIFDTVDFNAEGYMTDPAQWSKEIAVLLAEKEGILELSPEHWQIIDFCRSRSSANDGAAPTLRQITKGTGISTKLLFKLFPKGPAKKVAKISGLGKPEGCV